MADFKRSPLALAVLALLVEAPMHPYRMQQLIRSRGKDQVINVRQRNSLYQTIYRLVRDGLVVPQATERGDGRPDRTVYAVTSIGRKVAIDWLRQMLAEPQNEFPELPVAISFLGLLTPQETATLLEARLGHLSGHEKKLAVDLDVYGATLPRVLLLENEYLLALVRAELAWVRQIVADIGSGALDWSEAGLRAIAKGFEAEAPPGSG